MADKKEAAKAKEPLKDSEGLPVVTAPKEEPAEEVTNAAEVAEEVASTDSDEEAQKVKEFEEFLANR
jgi:hypothetical protein